MGKTSGNIDLFNKYLSASFVLDTELDFQGITLGQIKCALFELIAKWQVARSKR